MSLLIGPLGPSDCMGPIELAIQNTWIYLSVVIHMAMSYLTIRTSHHLSCMTMSQRLTHGKILLILNIWLSKVRCCKRHRYSKAFKWPSLQLNGPFLTIWHVTHYHFPSILLTHHASGPSCHSANKCHFLTSPLGLSNYTCPTELAI